MPWKERYTISDEKSFADDDIRWPQDARCCVGITVDLSVAAGPEGIRAADLKTPEAEFGANQGLAALLAAAKALRPQGDLRRPGGARAYLCRPGSRPRRPRP